MINLYSLHIFLFILSIIVLIVNYIKNPRNIILNFHSYILFFSCLYISIPSIITLSTGFSMYSNSASTILYASEIGIYSVIIFLIAFLLSTIKKSGIKPIQKYKQSDFIFLAKFLAFLIVLYIVLLLLSNYDQLMSIYGNRRFQSDFHGILISKYKISFLSKIMIMLIAYLFFATKRHIYLFFYIPFVIIALLLSGRGYIMNFMILGILFMAYDQKYFKIKYLILFVFLLTSLGILRVNSLDNFTLSSIFSEFVISFSSSHLLIDSGYAHNEVSALSYSISRIFPPGFYSIFSGGEYINYKVEMGLLNPMAGKMGPGGSMISEVAAFNSSFMNFIFPLLVVLYAFIVNIFLRSEIVWFRVIAILSILQLHEIFRGSFLEVAFYPVYICLFYGVWILFIDMSVYNKQKHVSV